MKTRVHGFKKFSFKIFVLSDPLLYNTAFKKLWNARQYKNLGKSMVMRLILWNNGKKIKMAESI